MSNSLVPVHELGMVSKYSTDDAFNQLAGSASFLPRVMLMGGNSKLVQTGDMTPGCYALIKGSNDNFVDLGREFNFLALAWRPKAMDVSDTEDVVSVYDNESEDFKAIVVKSATSDSGCMYGPEFLIWVPEQGFATFFMSSKTSRREAPNLLPIAKIGGAATLKSQLIKTKKFNWHGPVVTSCTEPFAALPDAEEVSLQLKAFNNPPERQVEKAPTDARAT